jgi:MarR family transcriptional regulator, organic hydroperoxide resistance regulator
MGDVFRLFSELERTSALLVAAVDVRLRCDLGLSLVLFEPLRVIGRLDRCRVYDLAAELGVSSGGASKLVDRLEGSGYCRRRPNPGDRRSSLLELTPAGAERLAAAEPIVDAELQRLFGAHLSGTEVAELAATLRDLRATALG